MEVEWLILGDAAQVVGNKLYLLGGGWDRLSVTTGFPYQRRLSVALSVRVPWASTNLRHTFEVELATEDGGELAKIGGEFEVGRPAGMPAGQEQRIQVAADVPVTLQAAGTVVIIARVDGEEGRRIHFNVVTAQAQPPPSQPRSPT